MSPEVWDDMLPRVLAAAASVSLDVQMPNEDSGVGPMSEHSWLQIGFGAASDSQIELGNHIWEERGQIFLTIMMRVGTGVRDWLVACKALSVAFRVVTDAPEGLVYRNGQENNGPEIVDGNFVPMTLVVHYDYQDISTP